MGEESNGVKEIESWLSPSQAGAILGTSGQWVTQLARRGELDAVRTALGWLMNPADVERLAKERLERAERKISAMKSARSAGVSEVAKYGKKTTLDAGEFADRFMQRHPRTFHELSKR